MVTVSNYTKETAAFDFSKSKVLQEGDKFVREFSDLYSDDEDIKMAIDNHIRLVNEAMSKGKPTENRKPREKTWSKDAHTPVEMRISKSLKAKINKIKGDILPEDHPLMVLAIGSSQFIEALDAYLLERKNKNKVKVKKPTGNPVEMLSADVRFVKRYAALHGKTKSVDQLVTFLHSVQKAITEKVVDSNSVYGLEVMAVQAGLIKAIRAGGGCIEIEEEYLEKYKAIGGGYTVIQSILLLKRFIALSGKSGIKEKVQTLHDAISAAKKKGAFENDPYAKQVEAARNTLSLYLHDYTPTGRLNIPVYDLQGLYGLCGIDMPTPSLESGKVVSSADLMGATFTVIPFREKWAELIGNPSDPFKAMIYGLPGNGKTTLAIQFAHYLASQHNKRVLFVSREEGFVYTFKEKLDRLKAYHHNLFIVDALPLSLTAYDVVFLDSVNSLQLSPEDLAKLYKKYPGKSFVCIHKVTKQGNFRGSQEYEHDVDVSISCLDMVATPQKNRFGGNTHVRILEAKAAT